MMFISTFNKLIRSKLLWGGFAVIVVLSFVVWGTTTTSPNAIEEPAGKLYGKPVPADKFRKEYFNTFLSLSLMFGRPLTANEKLNELARKLTWRRMVVMRAAEDMGIAVLPDEVIGTIEQQPFFVENGAFSRNRYLGFVQSFLARMGASEAQFEDQVREELLINKMRMAVSQAVWVSPLEMAQAFSQVYDTFVVSHVALYADELAHSVKVSEADARKYFAAHKQDFTVPEMARVKYAEFPFSSFYNPTSAPADDVRARYEENIERYSSRTTNGWSDPTPFAEVEQAIRAELAHEYSINAAGDKALDFEVSLAPDRSGKTVKFEEAAKLAGTTVQTTALFALTGTVPGLLVGPDFNQAAFNLRPTDEDYFSHPVRGSNAFYVVAYQDRINERIPEFEEVKEKVYAAAKEAAVAGKVARLAEDLRRAAEEGLKAGKSFKEALSPYGVDVVTTEPFAPTEGLPAEDEELSYVLTRAVLSLSAGELGDIVPLRRGAAVVYVESRKPASPGVFESVRGELAMFLKKKRAETLFYDWQEYLLKQAGFEDAVQERKTDSTAEDAEESSETSLEL